ncbi:MAG: cytochrome c-type biogenesis CcmF C-terminal domain-containing protein, partial [Vicinamibacterales bacterium]
AFVTNNYSIKYVQRYSDAALSLPYKIAAYWGGLDGSVMFWVFLLGIFGAIAVHTNRERHRELIPWVVAVIATTEMFFILLMVVHNNPFSTFLTTAPADGQGLTPLLQNFYMAIHPPSLYVGLVAMTIPYAFGMAALITGHLDDAWLRAVRRWTMIGWLALSFGLTLGMLWAYEELGWGGYWTWDPVENAGLLPWFTATAFLHSVMVQERRGMLRVWNVTLVITTFFLTVFATFMTRSGVVQSVHAFGEDRELARLFTIFMVAILTFSFGLVIYRLPLLRSRNELDSWVSREAAFLATNWVLLFSAFFVLFATMFPTLSEAVTGERLTVGPPFFNKWMLPIGLVLLVLTGVGPLLAWRKSTTANLIDQFMGPVVFALLVAGALVAFDVRVWSSGICFALCAFVFGTIAQEFIRGAEVRRAATGSDRLTAMVGLVSRSKRRYGGYIVHVGIAVMFLGFAGEGFKHEEEALLKPGEQVTVSHFTVKHDALKVTSDAQKQMITGHVTVFDGDTSIGTMEPAKWFFAKRENEPTTEVAIRRGLWEDVYIVLAGYDAANQSATYAVTVNPLVNWIWLGFAILAFGTILAMMPESAFALAAAKVPSGAATASMILLLLFTPAVLRAQTTQPVQKTPLYRDLEGEVLCTCGCRRPMNDCPMEPNCPGLDAQRAKLDRYVGQGMNRDQVLAAFAADYGTQAILSRPIDQGFNRLAWLFPYLVGVSGAFAAVFIARRWSRRTTTAEVDASQGLPDDPELGTRLDNELRDLD